MKDLLNNEIKLPAIGTKVMHGGYPFKVREVVVNSDLHLVAAITLKGEGGEIEVGYYDFLTLSK